MEDPVTIVGTSNISTPGGVSLLATFRGSLLKTGTKSKETGKLSTSV